MLFKDLSYSSQQSDYYYITLEFPAQLYVILFNGV